MSLNDQLAEPCPRCGSAQCNDPDSKACSDNCITRYQAQLSEAALTEEPKRWVMNHTNMGMVQREEDANGNYVEAVSYDSLRAAYAKLKVERDEARNLLGESLSDAARAAESTIAELRDENAQLCEGAVVPVSWYERDQATIAELRAKVEAQRAAVLEEAAKLCETIWRRAPNDRASGFMQNGISHGCLASAAAIRALQVKP